MGAQTIDFWENSVIMRLDGGCTMPTKDSKVRGVRIPNNIICEIEQRASHRGWTFNRWMNWAIIQGLRSHKRKVR